MRKGRGQSGWRFPPGSSSQASSTSHLPCTGPGQTRSGIVATRDAVWHLELEINEGAASSPEDDFYARIQMGIGGGGAVS